MVWDDGVDNGVMVLYDGIKWDDGVDEDADDSVE